MFKIENVNIRNIEKKDSQSLCDFMDILNERDNLEGSVTEEEIKFINSNPEFRDNCYVGYYENELVVIGTSFKSPNNSSEAQMQIFVHPDYRKKGIGNKVYSIIENKAGDRNINTFITGTKESMNDTIDFLKNKDFKIFEYMWKMDLIIDKDNYYEVDMKEYTFRKASEDDIEILGDLLNDGFVEDGESKYTKEALKERFISSNRYIILLEENGKSIATATVDFQDKINIGYISSVAVFKEHRGKGIGKILLNLCVDLIKERKMNKASLHVVGTNENALKLYEKVGFYKTETQIRFKKKL